MQETFDVRSAFGADQTRIRTSQFDQEVRGAQLQIALGFTEGQIPQTLIIGSEYTATESESQRDGATLDSTGAPVQEFFPFPTRDFPITDVQQSAVYMQYDVKLFDNRLIVSPGFRYDRFRADAIADAIYLGGNPGSPPPENFRDQESTGKLGLVFKANAEVSLYARYSEGFRAPPYDDVNVGFSNVIGGYKTISNPELSSETSEGIELGVRNISEQWQWHAALFDNHYDNFIESLVIAPALRETGGIDPADGLLTFQSVNRDEVEIKGAEFRISVSPVNAPNFLSRFRFDSAIAYAEGRDVERDQPLNEVEPLTAMIGVGYTSSNKRFGIDVISTFVDDKPASDIDEETPRLSTAGFGTLDLLARVEISSKSFFNIGVFNVTDKTYIRWADTIAIGGDAPNRFTQPGRHLAASFTIEF